MNTLKNILILLILIGLGYFLSKPTWPLFTMMFMSFPKLEETTFYEGTVEAKGEEICGRKSNYCIPPTYFVTNSSGVHEIYWGLLGNKTDRYSKAILQGATGKFWFDNIYGVVQEDFTIHTDKYKKFDGKRIFHGIEERRNSYHQDFKWSEFWLNSHCHSLLTFMCL